jgi:hypothetical protein
MELEMAVGNLLEHKDGSQTPVEVDEIWKMEQLSAHD